MYFGFDDERGQQKETYDFYIDVTRYGIDTSYRELEFRKGQINFQRICDNLSNLSVEKDKELKFLKLSFDELKSYLIELFDLIFECKYHDKIIEFNKLLKISKFNLESFDSAVESEIIDDVRKIVNIHISDKLESMQVSCVSHEYMHAFLNKYMTFDYNKVLSNWHYSELLSLLIEYIVSYEFDKYINDNLERKNAIIRFNHSKEIIKDHDETSKLPKEYFKDPEIKLAYDYQKHLQFTYLTGDIYATRLLEIYKDDKSSVVNNVIKIINGEMSIEELLKFYGLSFTDRGTLDAYTKKMTDYKKN